MFTIDSTHVEAELDGATVLIPSECFCAGVDANAADYVIYPKDGGHRWSQGKGIGESWRHYSVLYSVAWEHLSPKSNISYSPKLWDEE